MSTAIAEPPPAAEVKTEPSVVDSLLRPSIATGKGEVIRKGEPEVKIDTEKPEAKPEPKKVEEKKEEPKSEVKTQEHNFAELRKAREAAEATAKEREEALKTREAELAAIKQEIETLKQRPDPKTFEDQIKALQEERDGYSKELKASALARHPEFIKKYADSIKSQVDGMATLMKNAGIEPAEIQAALGRWAGAKLSEIHDAMDRPSQIRFAAMWQRAEQLDEERIMELRNSETAYGEFQKQQQGAFEQQQQKGRELLQRETSTIIGELEASQELVKNDPALKAEIQALLEGAARLTPDASKHLGTGQILRNVANAHVLSRHFQRVEKEKADLATELETTKKTLAERDEFIKSMNGSIPTPGPNGGGGGGDDSGKLIEGLIRPKIRV
jgi:hypothetical protein